MTETKLHKLAELGQSIWLDYIDRSFIQSGELADYVQKGLRGLTSNPAIFEKAISEGDDYDDQIRKLALEGATAQEIYEELVVEDMRTAADVLRPVYNETDGRDGFVSLEVNPHLAHDRQGTINEAKRLSAAVDRPNLMIKVPATTEGLLAFQDLVEDGVNINVTLLFSISQYELIAEAYLVALQQRTAKIFTVGHIASVASFFVSRVDSKVDKMLDELGSPEAEALKGKIGIANAKLAYLRSKEIFGGRRWVYLLEKGAQLQRVLYGSTSTKDPAYSDVMYVENLIGPDTVNTAPPETLEAFLDHGNISLTLERDLDEARDQLDQLEKLGIDLDNVTSELLDEGLEKFSKPYDKLIETITQKQAEFITA
jgi:transaldolase